MGVIHKEAGPQVNLLKEMDSRDFLTLGVHAVAYVRPVRVDNRTAYAVHAADGTPLSVMADWNEAVSAILHNELQVVTVH